MHSHGGLEHAFVTVCWHRGTVSFWLGSPGCWHQDQHAWRARVMLYTQDPG